MKRFFILLVIGIAIVVVGLYVFRKQFIRAQYDEIAELLPEESLRFFLEFPHFYNSMEELFTRNDFFRNFNRENLQKILPEETWRDLASILDDPYLSDPSKSKRLFNEQIIVAGYSNHSESFEGIVGVRGKFHPEEYYTLVTGMKFLQDEGFLIKEYNGQTYYEGKIAFDSPVHGIVKEQENYYIFNLKNCFFISNRENLVHSVFDFYKNSGKSVAKMELFSKNKRFRNQNPTIAWGFSRDVLENITEFHYSSHPNMILGVTASETPVKPVVEHFEKLAAYYKPDSLMSNIDTQSSYDLYEAYFERYLPMIDSFVDDLEYQPWLDFIKNNWDGGYFFEIDMDIDFAISPVFNLLFPLNPDVDGGILDELKALLEIYEIDLRRENNKLLFPGVDTDVNNTRIFYDETNQLLGFSSTDFLPSTADTEHLLSRLHTEKELHGFTGMPAGISLLNGEKLETLFDEAMKIFAPFLILAPDLAPRLQFAEKVIKSFDYSTGYSYFIDQDRPVIERVTYFQAR